MLIAIDAHNLEGRRTGVGRYLANLLKEWDRFDLPKDLKFVLYFKKEIPDDLSNLSTSPVDRFEKKIIKAPFGWQSNALFTHYLLSRAARKDKADILFCPGYIAPIFYNEKIALTLHDIIYEARPELYNWPGLWDKILLKKISKISAKKAKVILTCSEFSRDEILKHYQIESDKVRVIPLAADECFNVGGSTSHMRNRTSHKLVGSPIPPIKNKFILFVGSIFNRRHLAEAIAAFEKIAGQLDDYQFLIIGANHTSPFIDIDGLIEGVNKKLGRPAILRKDYSSDQDLISLYGAADLLVWFSDYEGFGLPILEAMACAVPAITNPAASIPEVAGQAAVYVKNPKNIDEIAQGIYNILTSENLRQDLIKKGLEQVKKFSWKKCAQETLNALLE